MGNEITIFLRKGFSMILFLGLLFVSAQLNAGAKCSCSSNKVQEMKERVDRLDINKVAMLHKRATTIDYAKYKLNPIDEQRFREAIRKRYEDNAKEIEERIVQYQQETARAIHAPTVVAVRMRRRERRRRVRFNTLRVDG